MIQQVTCGVLLGSAYIFSYYIHLKCTFMHYIIIVIFEILITIIGVALLINFYNHKT